ncbi:H-NS histone family protein [Tranquillimonas alkanivorans]|uniref:DNA-binding protein H-NS n=1 Tax=Tranquillimonas alkanivorans TaxID=441119 RepID=A0A1I5WP51_9RHOB|nr:H-NS histone family protein [Tranquillimonas alkanivorans]SFQ21509.1 DNA-binding protein H-NS [Tranquillimonas alkanivorans]
MADYQEIKDSLEHLSKDDLLKLQKDVDRAVMQVDERLRREARRKAAEVAQEYGISLEELIGNTPAKARRPKSPPKYAHPENPEQTWSGRGRQPAWVKEHIEAGRDIEELAIKPKENA